MPGTLRSRAYRHCRRQYRHSTACPWNLICYNDCTSSSGSSSRTAISSAESPFSNSLFAIRRRFSLFLRLSSSRASSRPRRRYARAMLSFSFSDTMDRKYLTCSSSFSPRVRAKSSKGSNRASSHAGFSAKLGRFLKTANHCS